MELEMPDRPYSVETLARLSEKYPDEEIFFVMGADSWRDITTWREWERVLSLTNHIVVTRPGTEIGFGHVTEEIRARVVDLRHPDGAERQSKPAVSLTKSIYFTDVVNVDISATDLRGRIREGDPTWRSLVPVEVANYIEKYQIYS
jgi:nicotinate-nucleotide adenylyltransferase